MTRLLTGLEEVKKYLNIGGETHDEVLQILVESLSSAVEVYLGRFVIERIIETEFHFFDRPSKTMQTNFYPLKEVFEITLNSEKINLSMFNVDRTNGIIRKIEGSFLGTVCINYKTGIADTIQNVPKDIKLALWHWIKHIYLKNEGNIKAETLGDYSVSYGEYNDSMPEITLDLLENYRKLGL
ncbi:hypothetical protein Emin_1085 [Elusimicrobium minutum Pei191]|uniref:Phage gp6-like head-tail connector protein n=1 Tax=Elusimicrobium minutum (strain Pei191) TaxID=445932 RepID=B2KDP1_ELUMP|nr:phage head-tail connector protein [Elusimicrobium minutum]ACC98637.1 hypothetical protein Emin_1085 [Elusimicrobium minutum Pei191]